jgi:hypothetical protein
MVILNKKYALLSLVLIFIKFQNCYSGPPFGTDDPETVLFKHWEYYTSSINTYQAGVWTGTTPHLEFNYGLVPNVQVHLLLPLNYNYVQHKGGNIGYADTEFGIKFRFIQENDNSPQIGVFPIVEIPTVKNSEFSSGRTKIYLPVWVQKSLGKVTSYGGAGYWINPGENNRNWIFAGWEAQYSFSPALTLGGELFYHSASTNDGKYGAGLNVGGSVNPSEKFHLIFSFGHSLINDHEFSSYFGLLWTI